MLMVGGETWLWTASDGEDGLDAAGGAQQVAGHRLGRVHHQLLGVVAESQLDRVGLVLVAQRRRGAVRVDVLDVWSRFSPALRSAFRTPRRGPSLSGAVMWMRVGAHAEAGELPIDPRAALLGVLVFFQHQHAGALAQHETVAVLVPGTRRRLRIVVAGRQRARRGEAADAQRRHGRFGAAGHHDVGIAVLDQAGRHRRCCAGPWCRPSRRRSWDPSGRRRWTGDRRSC